MKFRIPVDYKHTRSTPFWARQGLVDPSQYQKGSLWSAFRDAGGGEIYRL